MGIGSHVLTVRPKERFDVRALSAQLLYKSIATFSENLHLQERLIIKLSKQANTAIVYTRDSAQAGKLVRLKIPGRALPLAARQTRRPGMAAATGEKPLP